MLVRRGCEVAGDEVEAGGHGEGKVDDVTGSQSDANEAVSARANVVRESIEESSALVANEGAMEGRLGGPGAQRCCCGGCRGGSGMLVRRQGRDARATVGAAAPRVAAGGDGGARATMGEEGVLKAGVLRR